MRQVSRRTCTLYYSSSSLGHLRSNKRRAPAPTRRTLVRIVHMIGSSSRSRTRHLAHRFLLASESDLALVDLRRHLTYEYGSELKTFSLNGSFYNLHITCAFAIHF